MEELIFYTKLHCPLCDEAYHILILVALDIPLEIDVVDITHDYNRDIEATYADRIPVILKLGAKTELDWPFTIEEVKTYLNNT